MSDQNPIPERLYALLPAIHRVRDAERGQVLRALLAVLETELEAVRQDVEGLYDDWFIETCAPWVVPYLADLLGLEGIRGEQGYSRRAVVANTVAFRRRKGTASVLESLAQAETGWQARAVEFFQLLSTTQHSNHVRPRSLHGVDIRDAERMELLDGPFQTASHTAELRRVGSRQGRYNIPNVGIHLWRLEVFHVRDATARRVGASADGRRIYYRFDAIDRDVPLYNAPRTQAELSSIATEIDVPGRLRDRALGAVMADPTGWAEQAAWWFDPQDEPAFAIRAGAPDDPTPVPFDASRLRFFLPWRRADAALEEAVNDWENMVSPEGTALVDVQRGRLVLHLAADAAEPEELRVDFRTAFSARLGGGPYDRNASLALDPGWDLEHFDDSRGFQVGVSRKHHQESAPGAADPNVKATLREAVAEWNAWSATAGPGCKGLIVLMDSRTYEESLTGADAVVVPAESELWIVAASWEPPAADSGLPTDRRLPGSANADGIRPHLRGDLEVRGGSGGQTRGRLYMNGLRLEGSLTVLEGDLGGLTLRHCTQVPGGGRRILVRAGDSSVEPDANAGLELTISRSVLGGVDGPAPFASVKLDESVIDRFDADRSIDAPQADLEARSVTILGSTRVRTASATDSLFVGLLLVALKQQGCLRFCWVSVDSTAPRRYRCQPETALGSAAASLHADLVATLRPSFASVAYGSPAYARLRRLCRSEIRAGAEDGSEMGAFTFLRQPQRESNLETALRQYLRFGLSSGLFFDHERSQP